MDIITVIQARLICLGVLFLGAILAVFLQNSFVGVLICGGIVLLAAIVLIVISLLFWRCPSCGRHLPERSLFIEFCPHCGKALE